MQNKYHEKFLHHLVKHKAAFLIVGGQARRPHSADHRCHDLDIWVRMKQDDVPKVRSAIVCWAKEHPLHAPFLDPTKSLGPNIQIKFPEGEIVMFLDRSGQKQSIDPEYGVDVLTSLGDLDFDSCMERADRQEVEGLAVFRLSAADDKALKKQEAK